MATEKQIAANRRNAARMARPFVEVMEVVSSVLSSPRCGLYHFGSAPQDMLNWPDLAAR